jgi:hypothetical protein
MNKSVIYKTRILLSTIILYSVLTINSFGTTLSNKYLEVNISNKGKISFKDKTNGVLWDSFGEDFVGSVNEHKLSDCKVQVSKAQNTIDVDFNHTSFTLKIQITLTDNYFDVDLIDYLSKSRLKEIVYPEHSLQVKTGDPEYGYLVLPMSQGIIVPNRYDAGYMRYGHNIWNGLVFTRTVTLDSSRMLMPFVGASWKDSSVLAYVPTSEDINVRVRANERPPDESDGRISTISFAWQGEKGKLGYKRRVRFELVSNGYVGMAKRYRAYAKEAGKVVTLKEKIAQNPVHKQIIGAPDVKIYCYIKRINDPKYRAGPKFILDGYTEMKTKFASIGPFARQLKQAGVEKAYISLAGWNRNGYDNQFPDNWPPAKPCGTIEELKQSCIEARKQGYIFGFHDNYNDMYLDAPTFDRSKALNGRTWGGTWDGGRCMRICTIPAMDYLKRNLDLYLADVPLTGFFFDVLTAIWFFECDYDAHPMTHRIDKNSRLALLKEVRRRGMVVGGEYAADWSNGVIAFSEGIHGGALGLHYGVKYEYGIDIPLYWMVYHDTIVGYWHHGTPFGRYDHTAHMLHDLICAQPSSWSIVENQFDDLKPLIVDAYKLLGKLHERTAHVNISDHQFLSTDLLFQKSVFPNGYEIYVNYGLRTYKHGDFFVKPKGFRIVKSGKVIKAGKINRCVFYDIDNPWPPIY